MNYSWDTLFDILTISFFVKLLFVLMKVGCLQTWLLLMCVAAACTRRHLRLLSVLGAKLWVVVVMHCGWLPHCTVDGCRRWLSWCSVGSCHDAQHSIAGSKGSLAVLCGGVERPCNNIFTSLRLVLFLYHFDFERVASLLVNNTRHVPSNSSVGVLWPHCMPPGSVSLCRVCDYKSVVK